MSIRADAGLLFLTQEKVQNPASSEMPFLLAAVNQNVLVGAASILKGVGKDGQTLKCRLLVDALCDAVNRPVIPGEPSGIEGDSVEGDAEETTYKVCLNNSLSRSPFCPHK